MNLRQLHYFLVLSEELNFTRAAARCNVSQPPLSRAIVQLETELQTRLFSRDTHRVTLTAAGQSLAVDARRLLAAVDEAGDKARSVARGERGTLRLGFGGSAVYSLWPKLVQKFRSAAPDVRIVFSSMPVLEQIEALRQDQIDVGLVRLPIMDEMLEIEPIYQEGLVVALPQDHPLAASSGAIGIEQLSSSRFVTYEPRRGFSYHADLHALCRLAGFEPFIAHEGTSTEAVVGIVACGEGVAIVPASADRLRMRGLCFRPLRVSTSRHTFETVVFGLAWRKNMSSLVAMKFIAQAREQAKSRD